MPCITIVSVEPPGKVIELAEEDSKLTFAKAEDLHSSVVDLLSNGKYLFSLYRMDGDDGYWALFQRNQQAVERIGDPSLWRSH